MELMEPIEFTPEMIINVIAVIASLLASYFPALSTWYAGLMSEIKSGIMIGGMAIVTVTIFLLVNNGLIPSVNPITWQRAVYAFFQALIFNAGMFVVSPKTSKVKQIKAARDLIK
jgi:putative exporter of polyketide antibiotics